MQAVILSGGFGTRLWPLTSEVPKPVVPLVGEPFAAYMIDWLRSHGIKEIVMACGYKADLLREVLGDGTRRGVKLSYAEEPKPLGTAGAARFALPQLGDRFLVLNGDVLTDIDITAQVELHERRGAVATLALVPVEDPSQYGLVPIESDNAVREFREKPTPGEAVDTNLINAGVYVLEREVLDLVPEDTDVMFERSVFPQLVGKGLYGFASTAYWLDIGTPERYIEATADLIAGEIGTPLGGVIGSVAQRDSKPSALVSADAAVDDSAVVDGSWIAPQAKIAERAHVTRSAIHVGATIEAGAVVDSAIIAPGATIGAGARVNAHAVVGPNERIGDGVVVATGERVPPLPPR